MILGDIVRLMHARHDEIALQFLLIVNHYAPKPTPPETTDGVVHYRDSRPSFYRATQPHRLHWASAVESF